MKLNNFRKGVKYLTFLALPYFLLPSCETTNYIKIEKSTEVGTRVTVKLGKLETEIERTEKNRNKIDDPNNDVDSSTNYGDDMEPTKESDYNVTQTEENNEPISNVGPTGLRCGTCDEEKSKESEIIWLYE